MATEDLLANRIQQLATHAGVLKENKKKIDELRQKAAEEYNKKHAHRARNEPLQEGDLVLVFDNQVEAHLGRKFDNRWRGPYVIHKVLDHGSYQVRELDGAVLKVPIAGQFVKKFHQFEKDIPKEAPKIPLASTNVNYPYLQERFLKHVRHEMVSEHDVKTYFNVTTVEREREKQWLPRLLASTAPNEPRTTLGLPPASGTVKESNREAVEG